MIRLACVVFVIAIPASSGAQWHATLRPDDRIELRSRNAPMPIRGHFVRASDDSVWWRPDHSAFAVAAPLTPMESLRIYRGTKREIGRSALRGLLIGAAIGASLGFIGGLTDEGFSEFFGGPIGGAAITGAVLAAPGAVIGGLLGISVPVWENVPLPNR